MSIMTTPSETANASKAALIKRYLTIADEMGLTDENRYWRIYPESLEPNLWDYSEGFLQAIATTIESRTYATEGILHQITLGVSNRSEDFILDSIHFHELIGGDEYLMNSSLVDLLKKYKDSTHLHHPYREASEQEQREYLALCKFVLAFQARGEDYDWECEAPDSLLEYDGQHMGRTYAYYIMEPKMVAFIREHWDKVDQITEIIKDREITAPKAILPLLNVAPLSLIKGVL